MTNGAEQKTCFVIMGFGEKTDFQTQRVLDLDKTYRIIIKKAVEEAGLKCIRADEVIHAGVIDKPMYELLLGADVVVADLSTSNQNAIYELGVRHALRPATTIIIAESQFKFPFDIGHISIRGYEHLGKGIDAEEADRIRAELRTAIEKLASGSDLDSPVYTFLPALKPPSFAAVEPMKPPAAVIQAQVEATADEGASALVDAFRKAREKGDFITAKALLERLRERRPRDPYVIQQLALATYKSKLPTPKDALLEAHRILQELEPHATQDAETLGLWGAVHKRLWELTNEQRYLEEAIRAYERGFYLRNDAYTGINYAFLLNVRAALSPRTDAIADAVLARRVRLRIIDECEALLARGIRDDEGNPDREATFWAYATLVEARIGIGDRAGADAAKAKGALESRPETWMAETMEEQLAKLDRLLSAVAPLLEQ